MMESPMEVVKFLHDPIMEMHSGLLGEVGLYPAATVPAEWGQHPWQIKTANGWEGRDSPGLTYVIKPEFVQEAWRHLACIQYNAHWHA